MSHFDYDAVAELYPARGLGAGPQRVSYMRFEHAADALKFAFEKLDAKRLFGAVMEVDEERYSGSALRELYDSIAYPHARPKSRVRAKADAAAL